MSANYKIAELVVTMDPTWSPLVPRSQAYLCENEKEPICDLSMTEEIYAAYRAKFPEACDSLIEYMVTGSLFYSELICHKGMLLHASAVEVDGKAYLFSAPSGTGKSTHTSLWLKKFGDRAQILNDDKPAIRIFPDGIYVYGTPWSGKSDLNLNRKTPLQGIAFLERGEKNRIQLMPGIKAIERILEQTVRPKQKEKVEALLDHISNLVQRVPIYSMTCNMEPEAAEVSYQTMSKGEVK